MMWGLAAFVVLGSLMTFAPQGVSGQDAKTQETKVQPDPKTQDSPKESDDPRVRLPPYYNRVISGLQREQIYKIQNEYISKIEVLEKQIEALKKEREMRVEEVLTAEQLTRLREIVAEERKKKSGP